MTDRLRITSTWRTWLVPTYLAVITGLSFVAGVTGWHL